MSFKNLKKLIMKKIYALLFSITFGALSFGQTIFSENMGTPTGTTAITSNVFQNGSPIVYSGTADVRGTGVSTYVGASGGGNVWLAAVAAATPPVANKYFQIDGINTSAYSTANIKLSFGYLTSTATSLLVVEYSTNGTTWTPITFTNNTTTAWTYVTVAGGILPASTTLSLRFTGTTTAIRVDDVKVFNFNPACTLVLGAPTSLCNAITSGIDTYTATIPYTGGGTGTYSITPSSGTIGGDNPNTVAAGNITVSGITEGVDLALNLANGVCTYSSTLIAPECKIVNTLPYYEGFNYNAGLNLGAQQRWTNVNTGDEVVVNAGNLTYPNTTIPTGNSISFIGAGKDPFTPFTPITTGVVYASILLKVSSISNVTSTTTGEYFLGFADSDKNYQGRLYALKISDTQYSLGFDSNNTTTNYATTPFNINDTVLVVISFDFNTLTYSVWFNPDVTLTTPPAASLTKVITLPVPPAAALNFGGFQMRQDSDTKTPSLVLDELRIATDFNALGLTLATTQNEIAGLKVYPNPVSNGVLHIESKLNAERTVTAFDVLGKQVLSTTTSNNTINIANLNSGIYVVKITEGGKTATRKLVIK